MIQLVRQHKILLTTVLVVAAFVLVLVGVTKNRANEAEREVAGAENILTPHQKNAILLENLFGGLDLEAKSAYVWDVNAGRSVFSRNEREVLPLASLTKIMTALVARKTLDENKDILIDYESYFTEGSDSLIPFESWGVDELIDFMLVVSSNSGANALASSYQDINGESGRDAFVTAMNREARRLGLFDFSFKNPTGLDNEFEGQAEAFGSAKDVALLLDHVLRTYPELFEATAEASVELYSKNNIYHVATNTNKLVEDIPFLIGSKTGFTDLAGGNLVVVFDVGLAHPIIATVLGSSVEGRFEDIEKLQTATFEYFKEKEETSRAQPLVKEL